MKIYKAEIPITPEYVKVHEYFEKRIIAKHISKIILREHKSFLNFLNDFEIMMINEDGVENAKNE